MAGAARSSTNPTLTSTLAPLTVINRSRDNRAFTAASARVWLMARNRATAASSTPAALTVTTDEKRSATKEVTVAPEARSAWWYRRIRADSTRVATPTAMSGRTTTTVTNGLMDAMTATETPPNPPYPTPSTQLPTNPTTPP